MLLQIEVLDTSMGEEAEVLDTESIFGASVVVRLTPSVKDAAVEASAHRGLALIAELASNPTLAADMESWQAAISTSCSTSTLASWVSVLDWCVHCDACCTGVAGGGTGASFGVSLASGAAGGPSTASSMHIIGSEVYTLGQMLEQPEFNAVVTAIKACNAAADSVPDDEARNKSNCERCGCRLWVVKEVVVIRLR